MLMKCMRKLEYVFKSYCENKKRFVEKILSVFGLVVTIYKISEIFLLNKLSNLIEENFCIIVIISLVYAAKVCCPKMEATYRIRNLQDILLTIKVGDIFDEESIIVIPTSTTFDTSIENDVVSIDSVQGKFQKKYYGNNLKGLDAVISDGLNTENGDKICRNIPMKDVRYKLGTMCNIKVPFGEGKDKEIYFIAVADTNEYGKTENVTLDRFKETLANFWQNVIVRGHVADIAMPVLCSGKAGLNKSTEEIIKEIILSFVVSLREQWVCKHLTICINHDDLIKKDINLENVFKRVEYMCEYGVEESSTDRNGVALYK